MPHGFETRNTVFTYLLTVYLRNPNKLQQFHFKFIDTQIPESPTHLNEISVCKFRQPSYTLATDMKRGSCSTGVVAARAITAVSFKRTPHYFPKLSNNNDVLQRTIDPTNLQAMQQKPNPGNDHLANCYKQPLHRKMVEPYELYKLTDIKTQLHSFTYAL